MATFLVQYNDVPSLNIYALIFDESNNCLRTGAGFVAFNSDFVAVPLPIALTETRSGFYSVSLTDTFPEQKYRIEIYQRIGSTPIYGTDLLKGVGNCVWNKQYQLDGYQPFQISVPDYLGNYTINENIQYKMRADNRIGIPSTGYAGNPYYEIYNSSLSRIASGYLIPTGTNQDFYYTKNIPVTTAFSSGSFMLKLLGTYTETTISLFDDPKAYSRYSYFNVSAPNSFDITQSLGCAAANVNDASATALSFITTLPSTFDDHYNGQIYRCTSGNLLGQGRIVSDYVGATKRITLNKALSTIPDNGMPFIIYPIGGEFGLA